MMRDYDRFASLFMHDGAWRIPHINVELVSREEIRAGIERMHGLWAYFVQTTHPGMIQLDGDSAVGRTDIVEFGHMRHGRFFQRQADQDFMTERGVQIESWGPFAEGRNNLFSDPALTAIASAHGKSVAQVVLCWLTQRGVVVIPKSVRKDRMAHNMDVFDFELTTDQMASIARMDTGASLFFDHRDPEAVIRLGSRVVE